MKTADIRLKLHQLIDTLEDKKAVAIYTLFENEMSVEMKRKSLIEAERNNYLSGKGKIIVGLKLRIWLYTKKKDMGYKLIIRPLATIEILESYDWYETIKEGLGTRFLNELEGFYERLMLSPKAHSYYNKPVRQGKIKKFPFVVVYEIFDHTNTIVVYSVFMTKQDPSKKRIK